MKCKHYKGDGYTYMFSGKEKIDLCSQCEMELLAEMKKQEVLEHKAQVNVNEMLQSQIDKITKKLE